MCYKYYRHHSLLGDKLVIGMHGSGTQRSELLLSERKAERLLSNYNYVHR